MCNGKMGRATKKGRALDRPFVKFSRISEGACDFRISTCHTLDIDPSHWYMYVAAMGCMTLTSTADGIGTYRFGDKASCDSASNSLTTAGSPGMLILKYDLPPNLAHPFALNGSLDSSNLTSQIARLRST